MKFKILKTNIKYNMLNQILMRRLTNIINMPNQILCTDRSIWRITNHYLKKLGPSAMLGAIKTCLWPITRPLVPSVIALGNNEISWVNNHWYSI